MINEVPTLLEFIKQLQKVPYMASKNIYMVAQYFLEIDQQKAENFSTALRDLKNKVDQCAVCFCWKESSKQCYICSSAKRDKTIICVVETWQDMIALEKTAGYNGLYHILCGVMSPLDGIGPEDLKIIELVARVNDSISEIILALNQTPEGEVTATFIASKLKDKNIKLSVLARGLPVGSTLGSMDRVTVYKALSERRLFE